MKRRDFLRIGAMGVSGLSLTDLLRHEESAAGDAPRPKSVIYVVLNGGPSHIDMWDLKPNAPSEYRGPFRPIATKLPGVGICELMPRQAAMMDRLTLLRGIRSVENDHFLSEVYTGLPRSAGRRPAFGSIISRAVGQDAAIPPYVCLDRATTPMFEYQVPHYAGSGHGPFRPFEESLRDLSPVSDAGRLGARRQLLHAFDTYRRNTEQAADLVDGLDRYQARALDIMLSPRVRDAFDLSREPRSVRDRYGRGQYTHQTVKTLHYPWPGDKFMLARRLVEAGVRVVTLYAADWDHHSGPTSDIFYSLECLLPMVDCSVTALVEDLEARGLREDVLVVVLGEFGRTPRITPLGPGREHWADAGCALFYGGGLQMGQVIGETDNRAERSRSAPYTFENIFATIYQTMGIPLDLQLRDFNGRPQYLLDHRDPIRELAG